jgi:hypothetical protein
LSASRWFFPHPAAGRIFLLPVLIECFCSNGTDGLLITVLFDYLVAQSVFTSLLFNNPGDVVI